MPSSRPAPWGRTLGTLGVCPWTWQTQRVPARFFKSSHVSGEKALKETCKSRVGNCDKRVASVLLKMYLWRPTFTSVAYPAISKFFISDSESVELEKRPKPNVTRLFQRLWSGSWSTAPRVDCRSERRPRVQLTNTHVPRSCVHRARKQQHSGKDPNADPKTNAEALLPTNEDWVWGHAAEQRSKSFVTDANYLDWSLTLSLPRVINFKFLLQPHQKYHITHYEEFGFS